MASQNNAICDICGNPYHICLSCKDIIKLNPWKMHTDTSEHYKVYQVLLGYNTGVYDIKEAKTKLQTIDLSDKDTYLIEIKEVVDKILAYKDKLVEVDESVKEVKSISKKTKKNVNKTVRTETVDD